METTWRVNGVKVIEVIKEGDTEPCTLTCLVNLSFFEDDKLFDKSVRCVLEDLGTVMRMVWEPLMKEAIKRACNEIKKKEKE